MRPSRLLLSSNTSESFGEILVFSGIVPAKPKLVKRDGGKQEGKGKGFRQRVLTGQIRDVWVEVFFHIKVPKKCLFWKLSSINHDQLYFRQWRLVDFGVSEQAVLEDA